MLRLPVVLQAFLKPDIEIEAVMALTVVRKELDVGAWICPSLIVDTGTMLMVVFVPRIGAWICPSGISDTGG